MKSNCSTNECEALTSLFLAVKNCLIFYSIGQIHTNWQALISSILYLLLVNVCVSLSSNEQKRELVKKALCYLSGYLYNTQNIASCLHIIAADVTHHMRSITISSYVPVRMCEFLLCILILNRSCKQFYVFSQIERIHFRNRKSVFVEIAHETKTVLSKSLDWKLPTNLSL